MVQEPRRITGSFYLPPENPINKVVITNPMQASSCIRPSSVGKRSSVIFQNKPFETSMFSTKTQPRIMTTPPPPSHILKSSRLIPSQTNNMQPSISFSRGPLQLQPKNITFQSRPQESITIRHSPIKPQILKTLNEIPASRVIIQDDPKALSEINRLSSLNNYLSQQFNHVNNELYSIRTKTYQKEVVNDFEFL